MEWEWDGAAMTPWLAVSCAHPCQPVPVCGSPLPLPLLPPLPFPSSLPSPLPRCAEELSAATGPLLVEMVKPVDVPLGITLSGNGDSPMIVAVGVTTHAPPTGSSEPGDPIWIASVRDAGVADR